MSSQDNQKSLGHAIMGRVSALRRSHGEALEQVIAEHLLWSPKLVSRLGAYVDEVHLSDGRVFTVSTDPMTGDTTVAEERCRG